jgi:hypothetical protein
MYIGFRVTLFVTLMYDTLRLVLPKERAGTVNLLKDIPSLLTGVKEKYCQDTGILSITGKHGNFHVTANENRIFLSGSICKYFLKDNMQTLGRGQTKEAIQLLSDELHLPIDRANVTRVDIAENFLMRYEVPFYFPFLGSCQHYKRLEQNNGIYYRNGKRELLFYGKIHEQKIKGIPIPAMLANRNLLRYEMRFKSRLCKEFNRPEITANTLYDEKFYIEALKRWKENYFQIRKNKTVNNVNLNFKSMNHFEQQILLVGIASLGGEPAILQAIEQARQQGIFSNKMQVKRFKDKVKKICSSPALTEDSEAIQELDKKVKEAVRYYR